MEIEFIKYASDKPLLEKPEIGDVCLCNTPGFCPEGAITAEYTSHGFEFSGHGNIDEYVTGYIVLEF